MRAELSSTRSKAAKSNRLLVAKKFFNVKTINSAISLDTPFHLLNVNVSPCI